MTATRPTARALKLALSFVAAAFLVSVALPLAGCTPTPPNEAPGIAGTVTSLQPGDERPASFLVEGPTQLTGAVMDKASVTVATATLFFDAAGKPTKASGVVVGTKVKVWFDGVVAESYPVQGTAKAVQILGK